MFRSYNPQEVVPLTHRVILAVWGNMQTLLQKTLNFLPPELLHLFSKNRDSADKYYKGIRFKLTLFILILIAGTTFSVALIMMQIMDQSLLHSLIQRGNAITQAAATPAGYSLLMKDHLALDNITAQLKQAQAEINYIAILDLEQTIIAHDNLDRVGSKLSELPGLLLTTQPELKVTKIVQGENESIEFRRSIFFAQKHVGNVVLGISTQELVTARATAHREIIMIATAATAVGLFGAVFLSFIMTRPIDRLTEAVAKLHRGEHFADVPIRTDDELGRLTQNFNQMARTIQYQNESLRDYAAELESSYSDMIRILAAALDARDNYTYGHSARVARVALALGEKLELDRGTMHELNLACLLHDIGKIYIPDAILYKKEALDQNEQDQISRHPLLGSKILELAPSLHKYIPTVKHHHERYDGTGYPDRLSGDAIPLLAQIVALADTYDAMTSSRPYRKGLSQKEAVDEIRLCAGSQFNPHLIEPFLDILDILDTLPEEVSETNQKTGILCAS